MSKTKLTKTAFHPSFYHRNVNAMIPTIRPETVGSFLTVLFLSHSHSTHQLLSSDCILDISYYFSPAPLQPPWSKPPCPLFRKLQVSYHIISSLWSQNPLVTLIPLREAKVFTATCPLTHSHWYPSHHSSLCFSHTVLLEAAILTPTLGPWHIPRLGVLTPQTPAYWPPSFLPLIRDAFPKYPCKGALHISIPITPSFYPSSFFSTVITALWHTIYSFILSMPTLGCELRNVKDFASLIE